MAKITFLLTLLVLFSAFSCSKEEDQGPDNPLENYPAHVSNVEAPKTATVGSTVPVTVHFVVNNSCGEFRTFGVERKNDATYIKVYPRYLGEACFLALSNREVVYNFKPDKPGVYTFKFWSEHPDVYITKTVTVSLEN